MPGTNDVLLGISKKIRRKILRMVFNSQSSHIGSCLSAIDILAVLYFKVLSIDPRKPRARNRDRFILSKGHACAALYATLALRGFFSEKILDEYCKDGGRLPGHSTRHCVPGVEVSTGSLGHGLSMAVGMALAAKYDKLDYRVFALLGDGECNEGAVWEAIMFAGNKKLDNLIAIVDYNKIQSFGRVKEINNLEPFADKWRSFGWEAREADGHDVEELARLLNAVPFRPGKPNVLIAHTIKGKGVSFMENELKWHYKSPDKKELACALKEIGLR